MCIGANGLPVQNRRRGFEISAILCSHQGAQGVIEKEPGAVPAPFQKPVAKPYSNMGRTLEAAARNSRSLPDREWR
jgi:hypothetical protein